MRILARTGLFVFADKLSSIEDGGKKRRRIGFSFIALAALVGLRAGPGLAGSKEHQPAVGTTHASLAVGTEPAIVLRAVACRGVRDNEPYGFQAKTGTFGPGPQRICRFIEFENVGGHHSVKLVAKKNKRPAGERKDTFDDATPENGYRIRFVDKRDDGSWTEEVYLDGMKMTWFDETGREVKAILYNVGGVGE